MGLLENYSKKQIIAGFLAGVGLAAGVFLVVRNTTSNAPDSVERRSEMVTIRDTETGDEWTMNRGQFERLLLTQPGKVDPNSGIPSEFSGGRPTGVLVDKSDWEDTVRRINALKEQYADD